MVLQGIIKRLNCWYFDYIIVSNVYFLEPFERWICNALLVLFLSLVLYTTCVYLPGHSVMMLQFFKYLFGLEYETDNEITIS